MKIHAIFTVVTGRLYSVRYEGEQTHELSRLFDLWNEIEFLKHFFLTNQDDLEQFWGDLRIEEAVGATMLDARCLENELLRLARIEGILDLENLSVLFKPLIKNPGRSSVLEKCKARGRKRDSWLRIYAVRLNVNEFIISGGAIKLTRTMNDRPHLLEELEKLEQVCRHLRRDQEDEFGFFELF
jgi:hypothetical protein